MHTRKVLALVIGVGIGFEFGFVVSADAATAPTPEQALRYRPVQADVEYDTPPQDQWEKCKVNGDKEGKTSGWIVLDPAGQTLRRFVDTNGDNFVDQWRYFLRGTEVYRDIDSDFDQKVDESRWLNFAGTRWGIDSNRDGRIDAWKVISAEEASREAVMALINKDERRLQLVLVNKDDLAKLGLKGPLAEKLLENVADVGAKLRKAAGQAKWITDKMVWVRFDSLMPGTVPSEQNSTKSDLVVYENVMAMTADPNNQPGLVQIGEMIRIDNAWKLAGIPVPLEGNAMPVAEGGVFMQPAIAAAGVGGAANAPAGEVNSKMQELIDELQKIDKNAPAPDAAMAEFAKYSRDRCDVVQKLVNASEKEDRAQWIRQLAFDLTQGASTGAFNEGVTRLEDLLAQTKKDMPNSPLVPFVAYRHMQAEYMVSLNRTDLALKEADTNEKRNELQEKRNKIQDDWLKTLEEFVTEYPKAEEAPEALYNVALALEFNQKSKDAEMWYARLVKEYPNSPFGKRAEGALRRLGLKGEVLGLRGLGLDGKAIGISDFRGKFVLVLFWATWSQPCTDDIPALRALYAQYGGPRFEILGVNLDPGKKEVKEYLTNFKVNWPQIHEPGGMDASPLAQMYGLVSVPTMFLVDPQGKVISNNVSTVDLKAILADRLKK